MRKWLALSGVIAAVDQLSKITANARLTLHEPVAIAPCFNLTLVYHPGAAFSILGDAGEERRHA